MTTDTSRTGLGAYLRARRSLVTPEAHGLVFGIRRTPGLRREEVAMQAGVSTDYYIRLEQGRENNPSPQVLDALSKALLLDDEAAQYLRGLATLGRRREHHERPPETAAVGLVALMNTWPDTPALVYGRYMDLLATNSLGRALFSWLEGEQNLMRAIFLNVRARTFYRDWAYIAEGCVASLRAENPEPDDPELIELTDELSSKSVEFADLWARQDVRAKTSSVKRLLHPAVGTLDLRFENLSVAGAPGQHLVVYHADAGTAEEAGLAVLRSGCSDAVPTA